MQDAVVVQGLLVQAPQIEYNSRSVNAAKTHVGIVAAGSDGELGSGSPDDRKGLSDVFGAAQDDKSGSWDPAGLGPVENVSSRG